jgi:RNA polymerase sigma-70 factor (ECF subfamily)
MFLSLNRKKKSGNAHADKPDELLAAEYAQTGNKDLIALLFERYAHLVYGICLKYLNDPEHSRDTVMEIFEILFDKLTTHKVLRFKNWLYSVTRNHCLMILRRSGIGIRIKQNMAEMAEYLNNPAFSVLDSDENPVQVDEASLMRAVESLNPLQGNCIRLMYLENRSYQDISEMLGLSFRQVKSHIQNGKRNLKNYLLCRYGNPFI